jgi:hypothetical protein
VFLGLWWYLSGTATQAAWLDDHQPEAEPGHEGVPREDAEGAPRPARFGLSYDYQPSLGLFAP